MSDAIITVENLGKRYRIHHQREGRRYTALRDVVAEKFRSMLRAPRSLLRRQTSDLRPPTSGVEDFWALKDVSFEVRQGEVVGIIGRNGAGKSTLLKILSRITEPTTGRVHLRGRVASLLEVGTGFHPELTGRENIFLNGAILGMTRVEIKRKFDEIVAFAEVEKFLDTPVKRYSSGMYVRLAFAVAAHLEPEILIVDEVLAVGDAEFQKKCLGKMQEVARGGGRTVLFVSHNMAAVRHLCSKGIYLVNGMLKNFGSAAEVIDIYLASTSNRDPAACRGRGVDLNDIRICAPNSPAGLTSVIFGEDYEIHFKVTSALDMKLAPVLRLYDQSGTLISSVCGPEEGLGFRNVQGATEWVVKISRLQLFPGNYSLTLQFYGQEPYPFLDATDILNFTVESALIPGSAVPYRADHGIVRFCSGLSVKEL